MLPREIARCSLRAPVSKRNRVSRLEILEHRYCLHGDASLHDPLTGQGDWLSHISEDDAVLEQLILADPATLAHVPLLSSQVQAAALAVDPSLGGSWSDLVNWPIEAINAALLPTGKLLAWDRTFNLRLWDPTTNVFTTPTNPGYNLFCTGTALLADGTLFVSGGHVVDNVGLPFAAIYNPFTDSWNQLPNMNAGRWYPSSTTLANGDVLVLSGYTNGPTVDTLPQVYNVTTGQWIDLTTAQQNTYFYPRTFSAPNGQAFVAGPDPLSQYLDVTGTGQWTVVANRVVPNRTYGSAVMYAPGKFLYVGGGSPATNSAEIIDLNQANPTWQAVAPMAFARRNSNATLLPSGEVLITGGNTGSALYDGSASLAAELWNPTTKTFTTMASESDVRWYHSSALLLPDGRVVSTSGDLHSTAQTFSPTYLFGGARPTISSAPEIVRYTDSFFVGTPESATITNVRWVRLGSATHAQNWDQYMQDATFTRVGGGLMVSAPPTPNTAPPGYYMLFVLNGNVPSLAKMIRVGTSLPTVSVPDISVTEGDTGVTANAVFTIALSQSSAQSVTVAYATAGGTAAAGSDYTSRTGVVTFAPLATLATVTVPVTGDGIAEVPEAFTLNLSSPAGATLLDAQGQALLRDFAALPVLQIAGTSLNEGNSGTTNANFTVSLSSPSTQAVTVRYTTVNDTATAPADYTARTGTLTFSPGVVVQTVSVPVVGDLADEDQNQFLVRLQSPIGATLGIAEAAALVTNDDAPVTVDVGSVSVNEPSGGGTGSAQVAVTLSAASRKVLVVPWQTLDTGSAIDGRNYKATVGALTFNPGVTSQTLSVPLLGDLVKRPTASLAVYLQSELVNGVYGNRVGNVTIVESDPLPAISVVNGSLTEGNTGTANMVFSVSLSAATSQAVRFFYQTSAGLAATSDYTQKSGTITIAAGATTSTITVAITGDTTAEANETFNVTLSSPVNATLATTSAVGTIFDNDSSQVPAIPGNFSATPGFGQAVLTWSTVSGATSYRLYRSTNINGEGTTPIATGIAGTMYSDTGLANGVTYYYRVTAVRTVGSTNYQSTQSPEIKVVPTNLDFTSGFTFRGNLLNLNGTNILNVFSPGANLQLTDGGTNQTNSAFTFSPVNITRFASQFTFQQAPTFGITGLLGSGLTFTIQNAGRTALGSSGAGLGYAGIGTSMAIKFDLSNNSGEGTNSTGLYTNGAAPTSAGSINLNGTGIDLQSGHPFSVALAYDGTTLAVTITDTVTLATATQSYTVNIPSLVGGNTAYVGFTAGTQAATAVQSILGWRFTPAPAAPSSLAFGTVSASVVNLNWLNNDANATGVLIERKTGAAGTYVQIGSVAAGITIFADTTIVSGSTYFYRVRAVNAGSPSAYANEISTTISGTPSLDLQITVNDGQTSVAPGAAVTYTIVVTNAGPASASGARIVDTFPAAMVSPTYTATNTGGATGFGASGSGNIDQLVNMPSGSTITLVVQGTVSGAATGTLTNTATVSAAVGVTDSNSTNNTATDSDTISTGSSNTPINFPMGFAGAGSQFSFNGSAARLVGANLQLTDTTQSLATSIFAQTPVDVTSFTTQFSIQQLNGTNPSADGMTFVIQGNGPTAVGQNGGNLGYAGIANSVAVKFDLYNNSGEGPNSTGLYIGGANPILGNSINLTGTGIDLHSGHTVNVTLVYNGATLSVTITDAVTLASATQSYAVDIPALVGGNTAYVGFTGGTGGATAIQSIVNWVYSTQAAPPLPQTDLQIALTDGQTTVAPGGTVTYTMVVTNAGPNAVTGATVTDNLPATLSSVTYSASATGGATGFTASGTGNIGQSVNLPVGSTITYVMQGTLSAAATGTLTNTATVTAPGSVTDSNAANNTATDSTTIVSPTPQADLSITVTDGQSTDVPGTSLSYTIVVSNAGPAAVTGATISDVFPAALLSPTYTATATGGATGFSAGSGNLNQTINLPVGSTIQYVVQGTVSAAATGSLSNTATVTAPAGTIDVNAANNSATDTNTLTPQADLQVTLSDGVTQIAPGSAVTYTLVVSNAGPSNVTGATLTDTLPAVLTNVSYTATATGGATGFTASGTGNLGQTLNLPAGSSVTYQLSATLSAAASGTLTNNATVTAPAGITEINAANNTATDADVITVVVPQADLSITVTDGQTSDVPGTTLSYTIVVSNAGPSGVAGATVADVFPTALLNPTYTATATGGATGFAAGSGNLNQTVNLPVGSTIQYVVQGMVSAAATGSLSNTATVTGPAGTTELNAANNTATDTDSLTPQADLQVTLTDGVTQLAPGAAVTYTLVVSNAGPSNVTGATLTDTLPAVLSNANYTATATGGATGFTASGTGNLSQTLNLPVGSSVTYLIAATLSASATGTLTNTATVTAPASVTETNAANNSATDTDTITGTTTPALNYPAGFTGAQSQFRFNGASAKIVGSALQLTDTGTSQAASIFGLTKIDVTRFTTQFDIQQLNGTNPSADGMTFVIQGNAATSVGLNGGNLGYASIGKSVAIKFDLYSNVSEGPNSTGLYTNGANPIGGGTINLTGTGIDLHSGHVFNVTMNYNGTTLSVTIRDAATAASATQNYTVNIPAIVGGSTAFVGFTGATGGATAIQRVLNWVYTVTPPATAPALALAQPTSTPTTKPIVAATSQSTKTAVDASNSAAANSNGKSTMLETVTNWLRKASRKKPGEDISEPSSLRLSKK